MVLGRGAVMLRSSFNIKNDAYYYIDRCISVPGHIFFLFRRILAWRMAFSFTLTHPYSSSSRPNLLVWWLLEGFPPVLWVRAVRQTDVNHKKKICCSFLTRESAAGAAFYHINTWTSLMFSTISWDDPDDSSSNSSTELPAYYFEE